MKSFFTFLGFFLGTFFLSGQSFELMPGTERVFVDAQWLKTFDEDRHWSLFSRSRATVNYDEQTNLFMGAYANYTTSSGFGGTVVGRISSTGAGGDLGIHFFKANRTFLVYALASVELQSEIGLSWFSILRYTAQINDRWRVYSSLELFSNFSIEGHVASVQRLRAGLDRNGYQFGLALNMAGLGPNYETRDQNPGVFVRKQF
ncbi:hypothetical protein HZ996_11900 [Cryomorphaceae bacterium]|nr:hypothetical protein HZ996_11900 [Cryomorphaceae bacterium]